MEELEQEFFIILMIFLKKYVILLFQNERVCSGNVFLPKRKTKLILQDDFETAIRNQNLNIIGWRDVLSMFQILDKSQPKRTDNKTSVYW
jgi:glutamate synthase domain-containing protein 1